MPDTIKITYGDSLNEALKEIDLAYNKKDLPRHVIYPTPLMAMEIIKVGFDTLKYQDIYYLQILQIKEKKTTHKIVIGKEDLIFTFNSEQEKFRFNQQKKKKRR